MEQTGLSEDQFKVQHLLQRVADITVKHETAMANGAVQLQMLTQECENLKAHIQALTNQLQELNARLADDHTEEPDSSEN